MPHPLTTKHILAITIGNALEWYDFGIYSFFSIYFMQVFFPSSHPINTILATTATVGVALLVRPLGGVILGYYADRFGRVKTLYFIIGCMTASLLLILFTPGYRSIGLFAPLLILLARLLQGFATGGEFGVAASLLTEYAPAHKQGFYSSLQTFGQMSTTLLAAFIGMQLAAHLTRPQIENGGWRIPFVIGLGIVLIGIYIRRQLGKHPLFEVQPSTDSLMHIITSHLRQISIVIGLVSGGTVSMYVILNYMPIYTTHYLQLSAYDSYLSILISMSVLTIGVPFFGWVSDYINKKKLMLFAMLFYLLELYPCFAWLNAAPSLTRLIILQLCLCLPLAIYYGTVTAMMTALFPKKIRATCISIGFNMGVMLFGAFAQTITTVFIEKMGSPVAITLYPAFGIVVCLIALSYYRNTDEILMETPLISALD